jgi:hypothetical protein
MWFGLRLEHQPAKASPFVFGFRDKVEAYVLDFFGLMSA